MGSSFRTNNSNIVDNSNTTVTNTRATHTYLVGNVITRDTFGHILLSSLSLLTV